MSEKRFAASRGYAFGQLERALRHAGPDSARAAQWRAVLAGMADGTLTVGSRTPVADTPSWVTLEVAHGGFATGRYLAEVDPREDEAALAEGLPGTTPRERLNLFHLTDAGQAELLAALASGDYRIEVPEDAALMTVAWLVAHDHAALALDLVAELRPLMHRLRMTPRFTGSAAPQGATVRVASVGEVRESLREITVNPRLATMLRTLRVWHPLYDRLVELWCDTVEGDLPHLVDGAVAGGWPCRVWPADWTERRSRWLADHHAAGPDDRNPKSNFARLHKALLACEEDSAELSGRDVGWIRRALANTITRHGAVRKDHSLDSRGHTSASPLGGPLVPAYQQAPTETGSEPREWTVRSGSGRRAALRATQLAVAARPTYASLAAAMADRLDAFPADGGIPAVEPIVEDAPPHLVAKVARALEAPVEELVERGVITSGEVLAGVLPQMTSSLMAANIADADLATLYARTYAAFRRRRGLLLLNLEHQVRFEELPWVAALEPLRTRRPTPAARRVLEQTVLLALHAFPHAILPNPLVRELGALAKQADVPMPLVEEVAADIFMGAFTTKWRSAAEIASRTLAGTLYARYYDLPESWSTPATKRRWGKQTADDFYARCVLRAKEARRGRARSWVARNGTVLEQSQILTTHNLAVLVDALGLTERVTAMAPELADRALDWVMRRLNNQQLVRNCAYAWRQAIFFLSFCDQATQEAAVARLPAHPAVTGLAAVIDGARFDGDGTVRGGRRFLGWSVGPHWAHLRL